MGGFFKPGYPVPGVGGPGGGATGPTGPTGGTGTPGATGPTGPTGGAGAWDGALPLADQADITTGGPTMEWADFDPRTTPPGGLVRVPLSQVLVLDEAGATYMWLYWNGFSWKRVGSDDNDAGANRKTVETLGTPGPGLALAQDGETESCAPAFRFWRDGTDGMLTGSGPVTWAAGHTNGAGPITMDLADLFTEISQSLDTASGTLVGTWVGLVNGAAAGGVVTIAAGVCTFATANGTPVTTALIEDDAIHVSLMLMTAA